MRGGAHPGGVNFGVPPPSTWPGALPGVPIFLAVRPAPRSATRRPAIPTAPRVTAPAAGPIAGGDIAPTPIAVGQSTGTPTGGGPAGRANSAGKGPAGPVGSAAEEPSDPTGSAAPGPAETTATAAASTPDEIVAPPSAGTAGRNRGTKLSEPAGAAIGADDAAGAPALSSPPFSPMLRRPPRPVPQPPTPASPPGRTR